MKLPFERPTIKKLNPGMPSKHGMSPSFVPLSSIDGVDIEGLLASYGSPLYIYSEQTIRRTTGQLKRAFQQHYPKVQLAWSYKTNYNEAICRVFHQEGSWAEVVSGFEYEKAIASGVDPKKIIFNGPAKTREELVLATENGSLIHIDHLDELYMLVEVAESTSQKPRVAIRVNMDTGIYPMWDRFGFNYENGQAWDALNKIMHSGKLELMGLHTHIGTFIMSANAYAVAASKLAELARSLQQKFNHQLKYIDLGGGFASKNTLKGSYLPGSDTNPTFNEYAEAISSALINSHFTPGELPLLILETGRALIDESGYILSTVIANKRMSGGRRATIIDAGVNLLFTSFWYQHQVTVAQGTSQYREDTSLYGPLCMNIDCIRESINLPLLNVNDHVVIHKTGAYNLTQWMQFIHLRPNVVLIDDKREVHIVRKKEKLTDVSGSELIPEHLVKINQNS